jgi:hypothetical protein
MNELQQQATEAAITKIATGAQYTGAGSAVYFGLSAGEWSVVGIISGIVVAVGGFIVNWYYREQHLRLDRARRVLWNEANEE